MIELRHKRLMRLWVLLPWTLLVGVLAGGGVFLFALLDHPVERFVIDAELSQAERTVLMARLEQAQTTGVLSTDLDSLVRSVSGLPWVRTIGVRRAWPDALRITLTREQPVAAWGDAAYVSASGRLLALPDQHQGLPHFDVALASPQQAMNVYRLLYQLTSRVQLTLQALGQNAQGHWQVVLVGPGTPADGMTVALGATELDARMRRFLTIHEHELRNATRVAVYADLRYASGVAVRFEELAVVDEELAESSAAEQQQDPALVMAGVE